MRISRKVAQRERLREEISCETTTAEHVRPLSGSSPHWPGFNAKLPLPLSSTMKFGHRLVATITSWLTRCLQDTQEAAEVVQVQWISLYQLYLDYQMQTGELGPVYHSKRWIDTHCLPQFRLQPAHFKRRSMWFGRVLRQIMADHGCQPATAVTRPASQSLALHAFSVAIPWPQWRLDTIEVWLSKHLDRAATRDGAALNSLPPAKQDRNFPLLVIQAGPLCP